LIEKYKGDKHAELKIRQVIADSIVDWDLVELFEYCQNNGLNYDEDEDIYEDLYVRIQDHMATEMGFIRGYPGKEKSPSHSVDSDDDEDEPLRGDWDENKFKDFFLEHDLPVWGNVNVWRERYYAYRFEQKYGFPRPRDTSTILQKTDQNGVEIYGWLVNAWTRSILDLKNAIYTMAVLPSNSVLHLFINIPYDQEEPDTKLLHEIPGVHTGDRFVLTISEYHPPTKPELILPEPEPKVIWDKKERLYNALKNLRAENRKVQANTIPTPLPELTLARRMALIADQSRALDRVFLPPGNGNQPLSGDMLLDALEDLEERNARLGIRGNGAVAKIDESDDEDGLGRGMGVGQSHMADLYRSLGVLKRPSGKRGIPVKVDPEIKIEIKEEINEEVKPVVMTEFTTEVKDEVEDEVEDEKADVHTAAVLNGADVSNSDGTGIDV
jgi:hypothetical protein